MKSILQKIFFTIAVVMTTAASVYAQVPQGFNFQAVARGATGEILANQSLGVQVSIIQGTEDGNPLYTEAHTITTNPLGLIQIVIGEGTAAEGQVFSAIDFGNDNYFVKLAIDPAGGTEYADLGTTRLLSVPYALVAQKAVEGGSGGEAITEYNLNTADVDSSFVINLVGDKQAKPFQVFSNSSSDNRAIWGEAVTDASNSGSQRGVLGFANGLGTGQQVGVFGSALNFDGTGESRRGVYGQAASKAKYNYGVFGIAAGDGNGESETDPQNGDFGSFNLGGRFQAYGNLNGNVGVEGVTSGTNGSLRNFGMIGSSRTNSEGRNIGARAEAFGSTTENTGVEAVATGGNNNIGLRAEAFNGTSNIAIIADADTAAILNGASIINGDLTINGTLNYAGGIGGSSSSSYDFDTANPDSSFLVNTSGINSGTGIISTASTDGSNSGIEGKAVSGAGNSSLQVGTYGDSRGAGTGLHLGVYGVARGDESVSGDGARRYGLYGSARSTGRENVGGFGIGTGAGDGEVVALGDEFVGGSFNVGGFNIGMVGFAQENVNGNIGARGYVYGTEGARENRGLSAEAVTTASGRNIGTQSLVHSSQTENIGFHALMFDDGNASTTPVNKGIFAEVSGATTNNIGIDATVNGTGVDNTGMILNVNDGSNSNTGMTLSVDGPTGTNIGMIVNAPTAAELNGNVFVNGDLNYTGALNNTSDRNLKENIKNLEDGISTIMKLRPTSYNFRGDGEYKGLTLSRGLHYGLIAQEVEEVLPSLVKDNKHTYLAPVEGAGPNNPEEKTEVKNMDYKTMNYTELIPVLIKAVQEQQEEIETLRKQIEALKKNK